MTNFKASNPLPSSCPNTSNPTHSFQGAPTAHSSPNDPFGYVAGAFSCLANLRPPNMSSTHPNVCEETDSLWFDTLREVAFHFVKVRLGSSFSFSKSTGLPPTISTVSETAHCRTLSTLHLSSSAKLAVFHQHGLYIEKSNTFFCS